MDYFLAGGRPLLNRFPPHLSGVVQAQQVAAQVQDDRGQQRQEASGSQPRLGLSSGNAVSSNSGMREGDSPDGSGLADPSSSCVGAVGPSSSSSNTGAVDINGRPQSNQAMGATRAKPLEALHMAFHPSEVYEWEGPARFEFIRKIQDATRNRGQVFLMCDKQYNLLVAVKQMPRGWVRGCHSEFVAEHPGETELPWQDVGCIRFLNLAGYDYACELRGVYTDDNLTHVVTSFASEGDLFSWCEAGIAPGLEREAQVQPLVRQILEGIQQLHEFSIVHRDLSLENILMTKLDDESLKIKIIDFSMASTDRTFKNSVRGKASYQAPELHYDVEYDAFLTDAFSLGVTIYAVLLKDYPWLSTRPGGCKCFEYVKKHGIRSYLAKRKLRSSTLRVSDIMSEPLVQLLEGLLALDPAKRLTLGESHWNGSRRSVWDEPWIQSGPGGPKGTTSAASQESNAS